MSKRKLILYIACSLDGYIAKPNDDLSFLDSMHKEGEDYGYHDFLSRVDTMIVGRKTYDWIMEQVDEFPHLEKDTYIITRTQKEKQGKAIYYSEDIKGLIQKLKKQDGKHIFCNGGAEIIHSLLAEKEIDEFIISIVPVILGNGIKLFKTGFPEQTLQLISTKQFETGMVQLHYKTSIN